MVRGWAAACLHDAKIFAHVVFTVFCADRWPSGNDLLFHIPKLTFNTLIHQLPLFCYLVLVFFCGFLLFYCQLLWIPCWGRGPVTQTGNRDWVRISWLFMALLHNSEIEGSGTLWHKLQWRFLLQKRQDLFNLVPYLIQQSPLMDTNSYFTLNRHYHLNSMRDFNLEGLEWKYFILTHTAC